MYEHILIPYDGSDEARKGAEHAVELAAAVGATVHALYVIDLPGAPRTVYVRDDEEELRQEYSQYGEEVTGELAGMANERGLEAVTAIKSGAVHEEIAGYASENEIDLVVMGTAYRGTIRGLIGSTTEKVVRSSEVPVTTVRQLVDEHD